MKSLHSHYGQLTGQERFSLILAAGVRNDAVEQKRLLQAGTRLTYTVADHVPWAEAFETLGQFVFMELVEEASRFRSAWTRYTLLGRVAMSVLDEAGEAPGVAVIQRDVVEPVESTPAIAEPSGPNELSQLEFKLLDHMLAAGCRLTQKRRGWQQFCRDVQVPPFALWEVYPGYDRLRRTFHQAKSRSFTPHGYRRWMNSIRPKGAKKLKMPPVTAEGTAKELKELFEVMVNQ